MSAIFLITSGSYSDYTVHTAFSTMEKAKEYIWIYGGEYEIEKRELDEWPPLVGAWRVHLEPHRAGDGYMTYAERDSHISPKDVPSVYLHPNWIRGLNLIVKLPVDLTKEAAVKTATEIRARLIALNRWAEGSYDYETLERIKSE